MNRQVIKTLLNIEKRLDPKYDAEKSDYQYWTETPGRTAGWMHDLIFKKSLSNIPPETPEESSQESQSNSHAQGKEDSTSNGEHGDETTVISEHLEKQLDKWRPRLTVIEDVLQRWTNLDYQSVRQILEPNIASRIYSKNIATWHLRLRHLLDEGASTESGEVPTPARGRVRTRERSSSTQPSILNYNSNIDRGTPPRAPTPPSPPPPPPYTGPLDASTTDQLPTVSGSQSAHPENATNPAATEKSPGILGAPKVRRRQERSDSECAVRSLTSESESDTKRLRRKRRSLSSSQDTIVPPETQRRRQAEEIAKDHLKNVINSEHVPKKSESSKHSASEPGRRRSQERTKSTVHSTVQKSVDFDDSALKQKKTPDRRSQDKSSSVRESTGLRRNSIVVTGEGSAGRRMRQAPPNPRRPASVAYPDRTTQSDPVSYPGPAPFGPPQRQMSLPPPPPSMMGPWPAPSMPPFAASAYQDRGYQDRGAASDEVKSAEAKLQKQIDDLKKNEQARKEADEAAKLKARQEAEEAARYQALLQAKEQEMEQLKKVNLELEEKARRNVAERHEQEKISIEVSTKLQAKVEELEALKESKERQEQQCVSCAQSTGDTTLAAIAPLVLEFLRKA